VDTQRIVARLRLEAECLPPLSAAERSTLAGLATIVMPIGPYRNLTTLLAAAFALHPQALVLNHAAERLWLKPGVDLIKRPRPEVRAAFLRAAVRLAQGGRRAGYGGSILKAHAFDDPQLRERYRARYGEQILKPDARALFWKDSMRILNRIRREPTRLAALLEGVEGIKLLLPVRHPIHCARSNLRTGHARHLIARGERSLATVLEQILDILHWACTRPELGDDRLMLLWEHEWSESTLNALCRFCGIADDPRWRRDTLAALPVRAGHAEPEDEDLYRSLVREKFADLPAIEAKLLAFVPAGGAGRLTPGSRPSRA
jgi:hypothetical protein